MVVLMLWSFTASAQVPTFTRDVAPILQARCQECHRPGEAARFRCSTYEQARPWAKAIKAAVLPRKMPPWFADPHYGKFSNDSSLRQSEIDTLAAWVDGGAPQGDPKDLPAPRAVRGWLGDSEAGCGDRVADAVSRSRRPESSSISTS